MNDDSSFQFHFLDTWMCVGCITHSVDGKMATKSIGPSICWSKCLLLIELGKIETGKFTESPNQLKKLQAAVKELEEAGGKASIK